MEEMRKKAQAAVLNLLPLKMTFKDIVDAGIHPFVLRQVFESIGFRIPLEEVAQNGDVSAKLAQENRDKEIQKERERGREKAIEKEREEQVQRDREAKNLILQEKLRKQELILREQEELRAKELARMLKEEQDRKEQEEREKKAREEAVSAAKKKAEKRLQAEVIRKKKEDAEQQAKQSIIQQKFEEMRLPAKPPLPAITTPQCSSLPQRVIPAPSLPALPFSPSTIASRSSIMIPGLLLDTMDMGPRAPETPMTAPVPANIQPATDEAPQNGAVVTSQNEDTIMKDASDNRSSRKKRPVAADFDTEPSMKFHQPKRRFGSLKEESFIFELTEDEDEKTEIDESISNSSLKRQTSIRLPSQASKSPPAINGGAKPERNGKSPPARTSSAANGTTDAAKQLQDTEEKIRRLREEIQARQEKKRKPSATATPTGTGTPVRVATPLEIPGLGSNSSLLLPLSSAQLSIPSPSKLSQPEKTTRVEIPGLGAPSPNDALTSGSSVATLVLEVNPSTGEKQSEESGPVTEQSEAIQPSAHVPNPTPSGSEQKADEESESQKMRDEAERLRMLLLSKRKRKAMELCQENPPKIAKTGQLSEAPADTDIIGNAQEAPPVPVAEIIDISSPVNHDNLNPSTRNARVLDGVTQGMETEVATESPPPYLMALDVTEEASETVLISETAGGQPKLPLRQSPQSIHQQLGEAATKPESPPYEPSLENIRIGSESPPYEPSLSCEDGVGSDMGDKMDIVSDVEEGEIMEESVDMEVDSDEDDVIQDNLPTTSNISKGKALEPPEVKSVAWDTRGKDKSQPLVSKSIQATILPPKPPSTSAMNLEFLPEERVNRPDPATVNANDTTASNAMPMCGTKVIPDVFAEYESPLRHFRSYRYHPQYLKMVEGGWRSLTFSNRIDPDKLFCVYEISGGKCNDTSCEKQHFRQIALSGAY
ncbi:hypothetical protein EV426DRAFT_209312 [Tirmania nivea]|nr:hypothetical protein EV426DRAFT_209312 [Tirmania nivea]